MTPARYRVGLLLVLLLAAALRLSLPGTGWFGMDQARDLTMASEIIHDGAWPAAGPAMRNRLRLGGLYYGLWVPPAALRARPQTAYLWAGLLGVFGVAAAAAVGRRVGGERVGLAAAVLLAASPVAVLDERIPWPPAAMPLAVGLMLLAALRVFECPTAWRAAGLGLVSGLATQVHLSLVPLAAVGVSSLLVSSRKLGFKGLGAAAFAGLLPLVPMWIALGEPLPAGPATARPLPPLLERLIDILFAARRAVEGISPASRSRPAFIDVLLLPEALWFGLALGAAGVALWRGGIGLRWTAMSFLVGVFAVGFLPAEAWLYYLDPTLLPAAVLLGFGLTRWRGYGSMLLLLCLTSLRVAFLVWWIDDVSQRGWIAADFERLRLGAVGQAGEGRVRLLTLDAKSQLWSRLVAIAGDPVETLGARLHGPGFADLDTDNGYFEKLAIAAARETLGSGARKRSVYPGPGKGQSDALQKRIDVGDARQVVLLHPGDLEPGWLGGLKGERLGPLLAVVSMPALQWERAEIVVCDGKAVRLPLPARPVPDPGRYGAGEMKRSDWPCRRATIEVPIRSASATAEARGRAQGLLTGIEGTGGRRSGTARATPWRIFATMQGEGALRGWEVFDGPAKPVAATAILFPPSGISHGLLVEGPARSLRLELGIEGPATIDVFELPGRGPPTDASPRERG